MYSSSLICRFFSLFMSAFCSFGLLGSDSEGLLKIAEILPKWADKRWENDKTFRDDAVGNINRISYIDHLMIILGKQILKILGLDRLLISLRSSIWIKIVVCELCLFWDMLLFVVCIVYFHLVIGWIICIFIWSI